MNDSIKVPRFYKRDGGGLIGDEYFLKACAAGANFLTFENDLLLGSTALRIYFFIFTKNIFVVCWLFIDMTYAATTTHFIPSFTGNTSWITNLDASGPSVNSTWRRQGVTGLTATGSYFVDLDARTHARRSTSVVPVRQQMLPDALPRNKSLLERAYHAYKSRTADTRHYLNSTTTGRTLARLLQYGVWPAGNIGAIYYGAYFPNFLKSYLPDVGPIDAAQLSFMLSGVGLALPYMAFITYLENIMPRDVSKLKADWPTAKLDLLHNIFSAGISSEVVKIGFITAFVAMSEWLRQQYNIDVAVWPELQALAADFTAFAHAQLAELNMQDSAVATLVEKTLLPPLVMALIGILPVEMAVYPIHYWEHKTRLGWGIHSVHHAPSNMRATRAGWEFPFLGPLKVSLGFALGVMLGFPPEVISASAMWLMADGTVQHTSARIGVCHSERQAWLQSLGGIPTTAKDKIRDLFERGYDQLDRLFCGPNNHGQGHHSMEVFDKNFANTFAIFDLMFGTSLLIDHEHKVGTPDKIGSTYVQQSLFVLRHLGIDKQTLGVILPKYARKLMSSPHKHASRIATVLIENFPALLGDGLVAELRALTVSSMTESGN